MWRVFFLLPEVFCRFFGLPWSDLDEIWWKFIPALPCSLLDGFWEETLKTNHRKLGEKNPKNGGEKSQVSIRKGGLFIYFLGSYFLGSFSYREVFNT